MTLFGRKKLIKEYYSYLGVEQPLIKGFKCKKCKTTFDVYRKQISNSWFRVRSIVGRTYNIEKVSHFECPNCKSVYERGENSKIKVSKYGRKISS